MSPLYLHLTVKLGIHSWRSVELASPLTDSKISSVLLIRGSTANFASPVLLSSFQDEINNRQQQWCGFKEHLRVKCGCKEEESTLALKHRRMVLKHQNFSFFFFSRLQHITRSTSSDLAPSDLFDISFHAPQMSAVTHHRPSSLCLVLLRCELGYKWYYYRPAVPTSGKWHHAIAATPTQLSSL